MIYFILDTTHEIFMLVIMMIFSDSKWAKICPTAKYAILTLGKKKSKKFQGFTFKEF